MRVVLTMRNPLRWRPPLFFFSPRFSPSQTSWRRTNTGSIVWDSHLNTAEHSGPSSPCKWSQPRLTNGFLSFHPLWIFLPILTNNPVLIGVVRERGGDGNSSSVAALWLLWIGRQQSVFWHLRHGSVFFPACLLLIRSHLKIDPSRHPACKTRVVVCPPPSHSSWYL